MKQTIALLLALVLLLGVLPAVSAAGARPEETVCTATPGSLPFTDTPKSAWYYSAVEWCYRNGLMSGTSGTFFEPDTITNRAMIVNILWRVSGSPKSKNPNPFTDVPAGKWYTASVLWAAEKGIVSGYGNGKFGPDDLITREQFALIMRNYAKFRGIIVSAQKDLSAFPDAKAVSSWASAAVKWAVAENLISGKTQNGITVLDPRGNASRAEAASIFMRFCQKLLKMK